MKLLAYSIDSYSNNTFILPMSLCISMDIPNDVHQDQSSQEAFREFTWDDVNESETDETEMSPDLILHQQYEMGSPLGEGKTSLVYKGFHQTHGEVAIKRFFPEYAYNASVELALLRKVNHPTIIHCYDYWQVLTGRFISMERIDGDLLSLIGQGMTRYEMKAAINDILSGLEHLHSRGLVHFDLKPENIGYKQTARGKQYKIIDLGSGYQLKSEPNFDHLVNSGEIVLTTCYYRPIEAYTLESYQQHNEKTDIWSLGCIIYEMMEGITLFETSDSISTESNMEELEIGLYRCEEWASREPYFGEIVKKCVERDSTKRYNATQLLDFISHL